MATHIQIAQDFILLACPKSLGVSLPIDVRNQTGINVKFNVSNGSNYSRKTSKLYESYYLIKTYERGIINTKINTQDNAGIGFGKLLTIQLDGIR